MSYYFRDSPRYADRLRGMSDDELLQEVKQRFNEDNEDAFLPSGRRTRGDSFDRPFSHFPRGFPFDDETDVFERLRGDGIRAHLDDLATRHPELTEHLRGPPWPFGGSLLRNRRHRRRGSSDNNNDGQQQQQSGQQHQVDEDARSQASGSSAASGASAVSSHSGCEPDLTSSSTIPQYGLRNTVDIGQQQRRRNMEISPEKSERGQRSMSAPPENRQQQQQQQPHQQQQYNQSQQQPGQGQRFVSRVDITPQHNQQQRSQSPSKPASNVRHIPIFVEGRDKPVISKLSTDETPPPAFHHHQRQQSPPHFHRPSHFNEHFSKQQWPPQHFQNAFYEPSFEQPQMRRHQQQYQQPQHHQQQPQYQQQQPQYQQHHQQQPQYHQQQPQQPQYHHQQQPAQQPQYQQQQQEMPKPKPPPVPKDPLEKVIQVQKEVDNLAEQVQRYVGGSRQDKEYIYLDEMLTRELLKLDDIETEGRENVRQARKNTIKSIQDTISLLETKAPLPDQREQQSVTREGEECSEEKEKQVSQIPEFMDVEVKQEKQDNEPIPLPPAPSSPTQKVESSENERAAVESANQNAFHQNAKIDVKAKSQQKIENRAAEGAEQPSVASTDETTKHAEETSDRRNDMTTQNKDATQQAEEMKEGKTESPGQKKVKKGKKKEQQQQQQQQPVSEQAIPLPPPSMEGTK